MIAIPLLISIVSAFIGGAMFGWGLREITKHQSSAGGE